MFVNAEHIDISLPSLDLVETQWWCKHDCTKDYTNEDSPADQCALDQTSPSDTRVQEEGKGSKEEFEERFVRLASIERLDLLLPTDSGMSSIVRVS